MDQNLRYQQIIFSENKEVFCLVLSVSAKEQAEPYWIWNKTEDYFENNVLREICVNMRPVLVALFDFNTKMYNRPLNFVYGYYCHLSAEGSAAFKLEKTWQGIPDDVWSALQTCLTLKLTLPQNEMVKTSSKRSLEVVDSTPLVSEPKRQHIEIPHQTPAEVIASIPLPLFRIEKPPEVKKLQIIPESPPSKKTIWNGIKFRSKLEAETACFMENCGIDYSYESCVVSLKNGLTYMPDFWLPKQKLFLEIKPCFPHTEEWEKCEDVAAQGFDIVCLYGRVGAPMAAEDPSASYPRHYSHSNNARGMAWSGITRDRLAGEWMWLCENGSDQVFLGPLRNSKDLRWEHALIMDSYLNAKELICTRQK